MAKGIENSTSRNSCFDPLKISLIQMDYIVRAARLKCITDVAEECNVVQATVSMQIKKAETDLDVLFFDRTKGSKGIGIIEESRPLIEKFEEILEHVKEIEDLL